MEKILRKGLTLCLTVCLTAMPVSMVKAAENYVKVPAKMKPFTALVYDKELNCVFSQGGELKKVAINNCTSINARPRMSVVYDKNGYIRNVYYPGPANKEYDNPVQLSDPLINSYGTQDCMVDFGNKQYLREGRITYYLGTDVSKNPDDRQDFLKLGDCAIRSDIDDIRTGEREKITNTDSDSGIVKTKVYIKSDCGSLPDTVQNEYKEEANILLEDAVLGIFEDGNWTNAGIYGLLALSGNQ